VIAAGSVFTMGPEALYAADLASGEPLWSVPRDGPPVSPAVARVGGELAVIYTDGRTAEISRLLAVKVSTGASLWAEPPVLDAESRSGVTISDGLAFVVDEEGAVYAVSLSDGTLEWKAKLDDTAVGPVAVAGGTVDIVTRSETASVTEVVALDSATGEQRWKVTPDQTAKFASLPSVSNGSIVVAYPGGEVLGLSADDGSVLWRVRISALVAPFVAPAIAGDAVFVGDSSGGLRRISPTSGQDWLFEFNESVLRCSPVVVGNTALLGLGDGSLGAVDATRGRMVWRGAESSAPLAGIAVAGDTIVGVRGGIGRPEVVAFVHDADGSLVEVASPTVPVVRDLAVGYLLAFVAVGGVLLFVFKVLTRRLSSLGPPADDASDEAVDDELEEST
jgi:outer membrane protein assembly factor BamB